MNRISKAAIREIMSRCEHFRYDEGYRGKSENTLIRESGWAVSCGDFRSDKKGLWLEIPYTGHSDYNGATVEQANCDYIERNYQGLVPGLVRVYGDWATDGFYVHVKALVWCVLHGVSLPDELEGLLDYPLFDDEELSKVEMDILDRTFDSWAKWDFTKAMGDEIGEDETLQDKFDSLEDYGKDLFYQAERIWEEDNHEPIYEDHESCWLDVNAIAEIAFRIFTGSNTEEDN